MTTKTTTVLEMRSPSQLNPKRVERPELRVLRVDPPLPAFNKFLHTLVGAPHRWGGREDWSEADWIEYAHRETVETWVAYLRGTPAGYFELEKSPFGDVHIWNFGLLPQFVGQGLGGHLLTVAVERAWAMGAGRIWLSTCTHDHPHAIENYIARGFRVAETRVEPANEPIKGFWQWVTV